VGRRSRPTTASSSACARRCTSGKAIIASVHQQSVATFVSAPAKTTMCRVFTGRIGPIIYTLTTTRQRGTTSQAL
jgi:hypothetical protein